MTATEQALDWCHWLASRGVTLNQVEMLEMFVAGIERVTEGLRKELEQEKVWKVEDPRMLREQIRVADVAFNALHERNKARAEAAEAELNWQNNRNSGHPTKGGFEFYINEEWTGLATAALDADYGWCAALRKHRIDPDDERVRVRRVIEDDAILNKLTQAEARVKELEAKFNEK